MSETTEWGKLLKDASSMLEISPLKEGRDKHIDKWENIMPLETYHHIIGMGLGFACNTSTEF